MECKESQRLMQSYVDGELDLIKNLEIEQHLQACPICSQASKNHLALCCVLRAEPFYFKPPAHLQKRVHSALRKADKAEGKTRVMSWRWLSGVAALAFAVVLAWGLAPLLSGPSQEELLAQEVVSDHVRSLMASHLTDVASSDQHTVKPWFSGKLDFSPPVKDFATQGFPLVGGRLDYLGNRPVAALVYRHRQHFINLFIWPSTHGSSMQALSRQGYHVFRWAQSDMNFWAVSELNDSELQEFTDLVKTSLL